MVDLQQDANEENAKILFKGIWYCELPDLLGIEELSDMVPNIINTLNSEKIKYYEYGDNGFIKEFKNNPPPYIRKHGGEAITYYDFKNNKSMREMQVPNIVYYLAFIYNTLLSFNDIFKRLYLTNENSDIVAHSNSYVVFENTFYIENVYDQSEILEEGLFTSKFNKIKGNAILAENKRRYLMEEADYLYCMKLDLESFFPNLYTHYFEKIYNMQPYSNLGMSKDYFIFLDKFHQRINNNQTKGIPAGVFSSHIAAELCMLCFDNDVMKIIGQNEIGYTRYVDDLTFFSNSLESLKELKPKVQKCLNKFRLRINGNKTQFISNVEVVSQISIQEIYRLFPWLNIKVDNSIYKFTYEDFFNLKKYVYSNIQHNKTSQNKTLLTMILRKISTDKIEFCEGKWELFLYLLKLVRIEELYVKHIYKLIDKLIEKEVDKQPYINQLKKLRKIIDSEYSDSILQICHYFVMYNNMTINEKQNEINIINSDNNNPIILSMLACKSEGKNKNLFNYIVSEYKKESNSECWKEEIMFSKWWLPLFKIKLNDSYNYQKWMNSDNFPQILSKFISND